MSTDEREAAPPRGPAPPAEHAWRAGRAAVHVRPRYLHVVEEGELAAGEASAYLAWIDAWARWAHTRRVLFDVRASSTSRRSDAVDPRRRWVSRHEWLCQVVFVTTSQTAIVEIDMWGVADATRVRAFADPGSAHRWLCAPSPSHVGDARSSTIRLRAARTRPP